MLGNFDKRLYQFFILWYGCGVVLLAFDLLPPFLEWANTVFLILAGLLGGVFFMRNYGTVVGSVLAIFIIIFTIFIEWIGVQFGLFFGHYYYNPDFGLVLFDVPITIGFAWLMVITTTHVIAKQITHSQKNVTFRWLAYSLIGSIAAVIMDLILDPVAFIIKEYWIWNGNGRYYGIPFSNFLGWFFLAFTLHTFLFLILHILKRWNTNRDEGWMQRMVTLYHLIIFMFVIIAATGQLWLAIAITLSLVGALFYLYKRFKEVTP